MTRRLLVQLRARLDASPLRRTDQVWLDLDSEVTGLMVAIAPTVRAIRVVHIGRAGGATNEHERTITSIRSQTFSTS